ncbi:methionyl-tRNA synthetase, partial [Spiromyces aspiralis]
SDEAFYTESQVEERVNPVTGRKEMVAIESGQPVEWTAEENYKFRLGEFKEKLIDWINSNPQGDVDHTIYVWLDALVNYATVDGYPELSTKYFPADVHVVGKDILRFHAVYWPAFLMAAGLPLPARILAHAHWTMENMKMSKSRGNVADPFQAIDRFGVDPVRYYLLRNGGLADDGDYSDQAVAIHYKKDLAGQLGNLASRCMAKKMSPQLSRFAEIGERERTRGEEHNIDPRDAALRKALTSLQARTGGYFDQQEFGKGISHIFESVSLANKYISDNEPWQLVRAATGGDAAAKERLQVVLFYALETARIAGVLLQPIIPTKSTELLDVLGVSADERRWHNSEFGTGWTTTQSGAVAAASVKPLFPRIE